jgi:serine/threonine protein kinase
MMEFPLLPSERSHFSRDLSILISLSKDAFVNPARLKEVLYSEDKLYLIFEYCEYDLKKYMRHIGGPLPP